MTPQQEKVNAGRRFKERVNVGAADRSCADVRTLTGGFYAEIEHEARATRTTFTRAQLQ